MEIVNIEKKTFELLLSQFDKLASITEMLYSKERDKSLEEWLDNQDVCTILNISKRTLQSYRDGGLLSYSQIGHKIYYRPSDVEKLIVKLKNKK
ncbi:MAG: helix-turn-helix domain-containing protein [Rikenellaceae bacterium]